MGRYIVWPQDDEQISVPPGGLTGQALAKASDSDYDLIWKFISSTGDGTGGDGREVQLQATATHIQWRYVGEATWTNLIALSAITGPPGNDGNPGADGQDGQAVELQSSATHIQWRYVGAASWTNLIALSAITGPPGSDGADGAAGVDGADGAPGVGVPAGGTPGQALIKSSGTDYDADWSDLPARTTSAAGVLPATSYAAITYAATVNLDLAALDGQYRTISLAGDLALTTSNRAAGRTTVIRIIADASQRTLTFPTDWKFLGTKPANIAASKTGVLSLTFFGTADSDCVAAWGVQG